MIRVIITQLVLFALPLVGFLVYRFATQGWGGVRLTETRVTFWLVIAGAVLAIAGLVYFAVSGTEQSGIYVPAQYRDGVLVPGRFEPR